MLPEFPVRRKAGGAFFMLDLKGPAFGEGLSGLPSISRPVPVFSGGMKILSLPSLRNISFFTEHSTNSNLKKRTIHPL